MYLYSVLIFNNTRVIQARLYFKKPNGTLIEIFCLEPDNRYADITVDEKKSLNL